MEDLIYTHIYERALRKMGISADEYRLCNYVHTWAGYPGSATPGWCNRTLDQKAAFIGITQRGITKMQNKMFEIGLLENERGTSKVRATKAWFHAVHEAKEESTQATRLNPNTEQSSESNTEQSSRKRRSKVPNQSEQSSVDGGNKVPIHNSTFLSSNIQLDKEYVETNLSTVETEKPVDVVISFLNLLTGSEFRTSTKATTESVNARLKEKFSVEDILLVIEHKVTQWGADRKMKEYLRPITLFGKEKFEGYLQAARSWSASGKPNSILKNGKFTTGNNNGTKVGGHTDKSTAGAFS